MDLNGFREAQSPWFFSQPPTYLVETRTTQSQPITRQTSPAEDNRYPGWAGQMSDGRLLTDYRSQCQLNIPTGMQFASRQFMQRNAVEIINTSRNRLVAATGASTAARASTEMPPASYVSCDPFTCHRIKASPHGTGVERKEGCPELFGTFAEPTIFGFTHTPPITTKFEGGRNTIRGVN